MVSAAGGPACRQHRGRKTNGLCERRGDRRQQRGYRLLPRFPARSYKFRVQAYGTPAGESDRLQLAAGMQTYLQVQAVPNWEQGSSAGGWSFALLTMSPQLAQQYLPTMTNLGRR
jgi:hypothetical protein